MKLWDLSVFVKRTSIGPINVFSFLFIWQLSLSSLDDHDYSDDILLLLVPRNCHLSQTNAYTHTHSRTHIHTYISKSSAKKSLYHKDKQMNKHRRGYHFSLL